MGRSGCGQKRVMRLAGTGCAGNGAIGPVLTSARGRPWLRLWTLCLIRQALDCSPTNRERELGLDRRETAIPRLTLPRLALIRYNAVQLPYIALHCYIVYEG
ncbi:hypothetical protein DERF_004698 [Dermatophagoides farinae]|uniref:Uncharacterized protein n=1 Tax=Dermatophagoides farinae TaxID=6954 RepID=A0A922L5H2_DERFA|nr:hypothetical protein DERF_004698 [Dermatophagoides farinae]